MSIFSLEKKCIRFDCDNNFIELELQDLENVSYFPGGGLTESDLLKLKEFIDNEVYSLNKTNGSEMKDDEHEKRLSNLEATYEQIRSTLSANNVGLQNVYQQFQEIIDGSLIQDNQKKLKKIQDDMIDTKRTILKDINFIKKYYKLLPLLSDMKSISDESFDKLITILKLID